MNKETIPASEQLLKIILSEGEDKIKHFFSEKGYTKDEVEDLIVAFNKYVISGNKKLSLLSVTQLQDLGAEGIIEEFLSNTDEIAEAISSSFHHYQRYKKKIIDTYQESKSWDKVITTAVYEETQEGNEPFLDYVEEFYHTKVKDAKHLQKLTGITAETLEGLEDTILKAKICRFERALEIALKKGAKYKDLLQIKPKEYGLPEKWKTWREGDQYNSIIWAIAEEFLIFEPGGLMMLPSLKIIAKEIDAPYSVVMDAYKDVNNTKIVESKEEQVFNRLRKAVRIYIKNQPKTWRDEMLFNSKGESWTKEDAKRTEEGYIDTFITWFKILLYQELLPGDPSTDMEAKIIEYHKETIYKYFKSYLDEAKDIYNKLQDKAKLTALKKAISYYYLP